MSSDPGYLKNTYQTARPSRPAPSSGQKSEERPQTGV